MSGWGAQRGGKKGGKGGKSGWGKRGAAAGRSSAKGAGEDAGSSRAVDEEIGQDTRSLMRLSRAIAATSEQVRRGTGSVSRFGRRQAQVKSGKDLVRTMVQKQKTLLPQWVDEAASEDAKAGRRRAMQRVATQAKQAIEAFVSEEEKAQRAEKEAGTPVASDRGAAAPLLGSAQDASGDAEAQAALADAEQRLRVAELTGDLAAEREEQIDQIYQDTAEVHEIFQDVAELVEEQDDMVRTIEFNAVDARDRTEKGVDDLDKAAEYQGAFSTKIICFIIILVLIVAGVGGYLGYRFTHNKK